MHFTVFIDLGHSSDYSYYLLLLFKKKTLKEGGMKGGR